MKIKSGDVIPWIIVGVWTVLLLAAIALAVVTEIGKAVALWKYIFS
jgi:hypothetical protein